MSNFSDGRKRGQRSKRKQNHCTMCAKPMPACRRKWGLVWESGEHGACVDCIVSIRGAVGRFKPHDSSS